MKISHRSHPILEKLHNGSLGVIPILEQDKDFFDSYSSDFLKCWKIFQKDFSCDINIITNPFFEASEKAEKKLVGLYSDIVKQENVDFNLKGCYVCGDYVYMISHEVIQDQSYAEMAFFLFDKLGMPIAFYVTSGKKNLHYGWVTSGLNMPHSEENVRNWVMGHALRVIALSMFKSYAQVETKILLPNSKTKGILCKYVNQTKLKLTYLDSKWFTNLVKSDGFNVRGHFRLQPMKKNGEWTKELIWISEFEKTGYTAPARKIAAYA